MRTTRRRAAYLEAIYRLQEESGTARTCELALRMGVSAPSVTEVVRRLRKEGLVIYQPYRGVRLTDEGRRLALGQIGKHRLAEQLLFGVLRIDWTRVHEEALRLQCGISDEVVGPLEKALGYPRRCPHGNPIPTKCEGIVEEESESLTSIGAGESGVVVKLTNETPEVLERLAKMDVKPGATIWVREVRPQGQVVVVTGDGKVHMLPWEAARTVKVRRVRPGSGSGNR